MDFLFPRARRAIWLTQQQRDLLLAAVEEAMEKPPEGVDLEMLRSTRNQISTANERKKITLRLVKGYNTGLRLPEDAIPVHLTDAEAHAAYQLPIDDEKLKRFINPHQPLRGWRWQEDE